jgi:hypothetical protein
LADFLLEGVLQEEESFVNAPFGEIMKREREKKSKKKKTTKTNECGSVMMMITRVVYLTLNYILNISIISISISKHIIYLPTKIVVFYFVS